MLRFWLALEGDRGMIKKHTLFLYLILHVVGCSKDPSQILIGADIDKKAAVKYDYTRSKLDNFDPTVRLEVLDGANAQIVVPTFYLKRRSSNFTRILRCKKEYKLTSSTGVEIDNLNPATKYEDMKWIWNSAAGETSQCRFVGTHVRRDKVQDIAAESGSYYYLINPCVSKEKSIRGSEGCSNDLYKTDSVEYQSLLSRTFTSKASELSQLEVEVGDITEEIKILAEEAMSEQQGCEDSAAIDASTQSFFRGLVSIASAAIGAVVGSIIGGPIGAVKGANSFMSLARNLIKVEYKVKCKRAEKIRNKLAVLVGRMDLAIEKVIAVRQELARIEENYIKMDDTIASETIVPIQ